MKKAKYINNLLKDVKKFLSLKKTQMQLAYIENIYIIRNKFLMLGKILMFATLGVTGTAIVVPTFRRKLDRNILRPLRDYN